MATKTISAAPFSFIGLLVGFFVPLALIIAIAADGFWTFNVNPLSDLGVSTNVFAANLFNYTCIIAGILVAIFGIGKLWVCNGYNSAVGFLIAVGGVMLVGIGLFTELYSAHLFFAYTYFFIMFVAIVTSIVGDGMANRKLPASISAVLLVIALGSLVGFTIPGAEVICSICLSGWLIVQSIDLAFAKH